MTFFKLLLSLNLENKKKNCMKGYHEHCFLKTFEVMRMECNTVQTSDMASLGVMHSNLDLI